MLSCSLYDQPLHKLSFFGDYYSLDLFIQGTKKLHLQVTLKQSAIFSAPTAISLGLNKWPYKFLSKGQDKGQRTKDKELRQKRQLTYMDDTVQSYSKPLPDCWNYKTESIGRHTQFITSWSSIQNYSVTLMHEQLPHENICVQASSSIVLGHLTSWSSKQNYSVTNCHMKTFAYKHPHI